jgi:hypothetical protein
MVRCFDIGVVRDKTFFWSPEKLVISEGMCDYVKSLLVMEKRDTGCSGVTAVTCDDVVK